MNVKNVTIVAKFDKLVKFKYEIILKPLHVINIYELMCFKQYFHKNNKCKLQKNNRWCGGGKG